MQLIILIKYQDFVFQFLDIQFQKYCHTSNFLDIDLDITFIFIAKINANINRTFNSNLSTRLTKHCHCVFF